MTKTPYARLKPGSRRKWALFLVVLALGAAPASGFAQTDSNATFPPIFPPFPTSANFRDIKLWIAGNTTLDLDQVVLTSGEAVFAFTDVASPAQAGGLKRRQLREEVISPGLAESLGGRSATATLEFDCAHAETTVDAVILYPGNSLSGGAAKMIPAARWLSANTSLDLTDLAQAECGKSFQSPYDTPHAAEPALRGPASAAWTGADVWAQIGAFATIAIADQKWRAIQRRWPAETEALSERTETVAHGAVVLRRTLVGPFEGRAAAQAFCERLRAQGDDCLIRKPAPSPQ